MNQPISELAQEPNNGGTGLREPNGRIIKLPRIINVQDSESDRVDTSPATATASTKDHRKYANTPQKKRHFRKGMLEIDAKLELTRGIATNKTNRRQTLDR